MLNLTEKGVEVFIKKAKTERISVNDKGIWKLPVKYVKHFK